ncbi:hypothetical protein PGTUg99_023743 [Puccinia graminis f. sp. tritici]|uniref:Uncharacterized protein n=1 Tax=Puccinia graminis f. sp. tritici TaxID=56615 RepID=A0A5B0R630_PUCGR|nr:hypothetical protein PGTUg99_023743 [Puccinia graminis f. sp. tritici]
MTGCLCHSSKLTTTSPPKPASEPPGDNANASRAHNQPVTCTSAPFDTPIFGRNVPGCWPVATGKQPYASTPATVYSTPIGHSQAEPRTTSATIPPTASSSIPRGSLLPTTVSTGDYSSELRSANSSRPELRAPTAPPPSTATKLERIWEELETPPRSDEQITRSRGLSHASREDSGQSVQDARQRESERKGEKTTSSARRTPSAEPPVEPPHSIDLENLSNPILFFKFQ